MYSTRSPTVAHRTASLLERTPSRTGLLLSTSSSSPSSSLISLTSRRTLFTNPIAAQQSTICRSVRGAGSLTKTPLSYFANNAFGNPATRHFHGSAPTREDDFYETLGVQRNATQDQIKSAYHKLAMKFHPDKNKGDKVAEEKLSKINQAYGILKDEDKRRQYDQFGQQAFQGGGFDMNVDMQDVLNEFISSMGFGGGGKRGAHKSRGDDIEIPLRINFRESVSGAEKVVTYTAKASCNTCHGSGAAAGSSPKQCNRCGGRGFETLNHGFIPVQTACRQCGGEGTVISDPCRDCKGKGVINAQKKIVVEIPAGVDNGTSIRLVNQGDAGPKGGRAGHLFIKLSVPEDDVFKRDGYDVHMDVPITVGQAVLGGTVRVPTLKGEELEVKIPSGTQPGEKRILRGKGIPHTSDSRKLGNHYLHFKVIIPTNLTAKQKELMGEYAKEEPELAKFKK